MRKLMLFGFSDAGYGGLPDGKSTKSCVVVLGKVRRKEPELGRTGWLIYSSAGKMARVARPSLAAEVIALTDCIDYVQWLRVYLYEVFLGEFREQQLLPKDRPPLQTPSRKNDDEVLVCITEVQECLFCGISKGIDLQQNIDNVHIWLAGDEVSVRRLKVMVLTDCSNAYASISAIFANSSERSMRILLAYLRGNLLSVCLSFFDACRNLPDVGTKNGGNIGIYRRFTRFGLFVVTFLGRKASAVSMQMEASTKSGANKRFH